MSYPKYPDTYVKEIKIGDKNYKIEIGKFSEQASAAVLVTCGGTVVHSTVALGRPVNLGYFPLGVEFAEKLYAGGIIKGSRWVKRDGRPTDEAILKARVIDRTMRPMFEDGVTHEVQIINTVFSYDTENDADMLGLLGSGIGLAVSEIPFEGPVTGLRVGYKKSEGQFVFNPDNTYREEADLDLIVSGTRDSIVMVEAGANEIDEATMVEALTAAQSEIAQIVGQIDAIVKEVGKEKVELVSPESKIQTEKIEELAEKILADHEKEVAEAVAKTAKLEKVDNTDLIEKLLTTFNKGKVDDAEDLVEEKHVKSALHLAEKKYARSQIIDKKMRPDGRAPEEIRPIWCEVDVFERTHGSAMFKRGATQAITFTTLGSPSLGQYIEDMDGQEIRHYMHHYNMPPYASGEAGRFGAPKRREIGHGALAERALMPVIPPQDEFPYTIHVVSEIVSSNGSTSQASVCGSTMSLMAAGVPIRKPVAGIAMGLMSDGKKYQVLSDIQGLEDHVGDMDFKVAGTSEGITAIQMDIKLKGLDKKILTESLEQAKKGRLHILAEMLKVISEPRHEISKYAPKIEQITIPQERIGELIGPGGKMIKSIIEKSGAQVDVDEDEEQKLGLINISAVDQSAIDMAKNIIENMMRVVEIGDEFDGPVTRIEDYGCFVEYLPGREGLVHVSNMAGEFVSDPRSLVKLGDTVHVRVSEIKDDGKIGLSMLTKDQEMEAKSNAASCPPFRGGRGGSNNSGGRSFGYNRGGSSRGYSNNNRGDNRGGSRSSGGRSFGNRSQGGYDRRPQREI